MINSNRIFQMAAFKICKVSIIYILLATISSYSEAVCPDSSQIKPCTCDDEGLQCLKLDNAGLKRVFNAPAELKAIRRVWIFQTNLTRLDKNSFGDYIIRDLYLDLNKISQVEPGAFGEATSTLQSLSLTRNSLNTFPFYDLTSMKRLRQLGLGHNQLTSIPFGTFPPSGSLESIDLSHNLIQKIDSNSFAELYEVSLIDLSRNKLKSIESKGLMVKSNFRHLAISLRGNQINKIATDAFGDHHPHAIDFSKNNFTYLDELAFGPLIANNTVIDVDGNPFSCSGCELYKWLVELENEYQGNILNFVCTDDTKLEDLTLDMIGCDANNNSNNYETQNDNQ